MEGDGNGEGISIGIETENNNSTSMLTTRYIKYQVERFWVIIR